MASDSQSEPIRAIGGRLKIGGHPAPPVGEFADRAGWPTTEGAELRRETPSEGPRLRSPVWGRNSPAGGGSPIRGTTSPAPPSATAADGNGNWGRGLGETNSPNPLPPFAVLVCSSSAFPPMSCLEIRVVGPKFLKTTLPAPGPFPSIGTLSSLRSLDRAEESPQPRFPPSPTFLRGEHRRFLRLENGGRTGSPAPPSAVGADGNGNWGRGLGETRSPIATPPFPVVFRYSSAFPLMSCLEIRVRGPEFQRPPPPAPRL